MPKISLEDVEKLRETSPRRRHFAESQSSPNSDGSISLSFRFDFVAELFAEETGLPLRNGPYGPWCKVVDPKDVTVALDWKRRRDDVVFLHDTLEFSMALGFNFVRESEYSDLGLAEHNTKEAAHEPSLKILTDALIAAVSDYPPLAKCDAICAVTPAPGKNWDLPTELVRRVAKACGKEDISAELKFLKKKESVKNLPLAEKWKALESADLNVLKPLKGRRIILIDDKYQSGTTAQFVASKLYEAGADEVVGLYCVKTWRDTDNI